MALAGALRRMVRHLNGTPRQLLNGARLVHAFLSVGFTELVMQLTPGYGRDP
jgi:hypothetical protein